MTFLLSLFQLAVGDENARTNTATGKEDKLTRDENGPTQWLCFRKLIEFAVFVLFSFFRSSNSGFRLVNSLSAFSLLVCSAFRWFCNSSSATHAFFSFTNISDFSLQLSRDFFIEVGPLISSIVREVVWNIVGSPQDCTSVCFVLPNCLPLYAVSVYACAKPGPIADTFMRTFILLNSQKWLTL